MIKMLKQLQSKCVVIFKCLARIGFVKFKDIILIRHSILEAAAKLAAIKMDRAASLSPSVERIRRNQP